MREYRGRYFIRRRVWRCGDYTEVEVYPVWQRPGVRREKCRPTREAQRRLNQRDSERKFARLVRLNFGKGDYALDLTYDREAEEAEARKELTDFLRQVRKAYRAEGSELKYVYTLERGKKSGRVHFHLILNAAALSREDLEDLWPHGWANCKRLRFDESGLVGLSKYITKRGRDRAMAGKRRWSCSRNLARPQPEIEDSAVTRPELEDLLDAVERRDAAAELRKTWPGLELVEAEGLRNRLNRGAYVHLSLCRRERWNGRPPQARYAYAEVGEDECFE